MIPRLNITAWGQTVPWVDERQVEQDLIISRAIIELFNDPFLKDQLRCLPTCRNSKSPASQSS